MINYAILGMLNEKSMSGYDIKKIMQDSLYMYWSGNNNQVYKVLLQLCSDALITCETVHQDGAPSKKIYSISEKGIRVLNEWVSSTQPDVPEFRKPFLLQIINAGAADAETLRRLSGEYKSELETHLRMQQEKHRREAPRSTAREQFLLNAVYDNIASFYQAELDWVQRFEDGLSHYFS